MIKRSLAKTADRKQLKLDFRSSERQEIPTCPVCNRVLWLDVSFSTLHIDQCLSRSTDHDAPANHEMIDLSFEKQANDLLEPAYKKHKVTDSSLSLPPLDEASPPSLPADKISSTKDVATRESTDRAAGRAIALGDSAREPSSELSSSMAQAVGIVQRMVVESGLRIEAMTALPGLFLVHNFITEEEESALVHHLDSDPVTSWHFSSFNGHCQSKVFGVRTQFGLPREERLVRQLVKDQGEQDIPSFFLGFAERAKALMRVFSPSLPSLPTELFDLQVNDCNANSYLKANKDYLKPHYDDRALSGPLLLNLSLLGECYMTYLRPNPNKLEVSHQPYVDIRKVLLPRRTLQIVSQTARWSYMHSISAEDVLSDRRVSLTFRQSGDRKLGVVPTQQKSKEALQAFLRPMA